MFKGDQDDVPAQLFGDLYEGAEHFGTGESVSVGEYSDPCVV